MTRRVQANAGDHPVEAAIREGKFPESRRAHYMALMAKNAEKTERLIAKLEPVLAPPDEMEGVRRFVEQRPQAISAAPPPSGPTDYPRDWVPSQQVGTITFEDAQTAAAVGKFGPT